MIRHLVVCTVFLAVSFAAPPRAANAAATRDRFDPELAQHPYVGKLYTQAFRSGVRVQTEFRGEWSSDKSTCGTDGDDLDIRIFVDAVTVGFGDETHVVTKAKKRGPLSVALTYGPLIPKYQSRIAPPVLSLSPDKAVLQVWDNSGHKLQGRWMKCP